MKSSSVFIFFMDGVVCGRIFCGGVRMCLLSLSCMRCARIMFFVWYAALAI
jgi:hypothetical protein